MFEHQVDTMNEVHDYYLCVTLDCGHYIEEVIRSTQSKFLMAVVSLQTIEEIDCEPCSIMFDTPTVSNRKSHKVILLGKSIDVDKVKIGIEIRKQVMLEDALW